MDAYFAMYAVLGLGVLGTLAGLYSARHPVKFGRKRRSAQHTA